MLITVLPPVTQPLPPATAPAPAPGTQVPAPTPPPPTPDPTEPPTADCLLDLAALGVEPEALLGIETEVACQEHLVLLGPVRVDELPLLGPIIGG